MSTHMFHHQCDICGKRSAEYESFPSCTEFMHDICRECMVPGTLDEEEGRCLCSTCKEEA